MGILNVAITGLNAAPVGIRTTSHNIGNASTEGYNRQRIVQSTNLPMFTGAGFIGQGTNVSTVRRIYSEHLDTQMQSATTSAAEMNAYHSQVSQIDNLFADPSSGLSPALSDFFKAVQEMTAYPASIPARQAMLSASQSLVGRFQLLDQRLDEIRSGVNSMINSEVAELNSYAKEIADINQRIVIAQATGPTQPASDLLDQRDKLITDLNTKIRASVVTQSDGTFSVFIGNGQPLVVGTVPFALKAENDPEDVRRTIVSLENPGGGTSSIPETMLTGGALGGLLAFRRESLDAAQNALGRVALTLANDFNSQHALGQDLYGNLGTNYFDMSKMSPAVMASNNNVAPAGTVGVVISDYSDLTTSDYRLTSNGGGNYTLLRLSDNQVLVNNAALPVSIDGLAITAASVPAAGNSFLIQPTRGGGANIAMRMNDPREIAAAAPVRTTTPLSNSGAARIDAGVVTSVASLPAVGSPITLTYDLGTNSFSGFPVGSQVTVTPPLPAAPANYNIAATTDPVIYVPGATIEFNGMKVTISGTPADNDSFVIERNASGVSDNRNGALLAALQTSNTMMGDSVSGVNPTATYQSAYSAIVAQIGNKTREVEVGGEAQQALLERTKSIQAELSGVNLDEEAANLLRYQQAYQAAAKVIGIAGTLFDEILAVAR